MQSPLLTMSGVTKWFGATCALDEVSLTAVQGEVMALLGENGAGKSTLMKVLSGAVAPDSGVMTIADQPYRPASPLDARAAGVAMIYQELTLAPDLSVEDNIMLGQEHHAAGFLLRDSQATRVHEVLRLLGHPELRPDALVSTLSVGAQQLVEIARALVQDAQLIVFDEPTSSLAQRDVEHLFRVIRMLRDAGRAVIYISHFLEEIREVCTRYTVLRDGRTVGSGALADVAEEELVTLMVGRQVNDLFPHVPHALGETILEVHGLSGRTAPDDVSLRLRRGEIFGVAGLVGAGRTELLRCIYGLDLVVRGQVAVQQLRLSHSPSSSIAAGVGMVCEDRKVEGLAQDRSLAENITYSRLAPYQRWGLLDLEARDHQVQSWMTRLQIKARSAEQAVAGLSGGNQQKVAIARVLHQEADVLLLDEPTRGIDVGTKSEIYRLIGELAAQGRGVLVVSSYIPELLAICDTIGVMSRGRLVEVRAAEKWSAEEILSRAIGIEGPTP